MHCEFETSTPSDVTWLKDDKPLKITSQVGSKYFGNPKDLSTNIVGKHSSILMITNVNKNDLGEYMCKVQNTIGSQNINITLTYVPEPPVLQAPVGRDGQDTITHWHIRSLLPLTEVMLKYRRKDVRHNLI